jgi:ribosomal-protein-alanine N-acetyltransferase
LPPFTALNLRTGRLTIRWLEETDIPEFFKIFSHPEVMRYWSCPPFTEIAQAEKLVYDIIGDYQTGRSLQVGIERTADGVLIGTTTLLHFNIQCARAEIGYALGRPYWGSGYMYEALQAFVHYAFDTLDLRRLEADIDPRNTASAKTLERLGFQKEGHLRERWVVNGEVSDTGYYGLLKSDWLEIERDVVQKNAL